MYPGEIFVLLGHNGAGKSTTMKVLAGYISDYSGSVQIYQYTDVRDMRERGEVGYCPQHVVLWDDLTVKEHVKLFQALKAPRRRMALDLYDRKDTLVRKLSGGLQRLLTVGLSFVGSPKFVILDEPTAGVDPITTTKIWEFLHRMKRDRIVMLTTHCMLEAESISDRVGIMKDGRIECWGSSAFLKRRFECGYKLLLELNS
ncbi:unnamed protein product, partial [Amoebophrya sp. A25]|eukprot:GSA25T00007759001.1